MLNVDLSPTLPIVRVDYVIHMNRAAFDRIPVYQVPPDEPSTPILFGVMQTDYELTPYARLMLNLDRYKASAN